MASAAEVAKNYDGSNFVVSLVTLALGIVAAVIAYFSFKDSKKRRATENAVKLAKVFQEEILTESSLINIIAQQCGYADIASKHIKLEKINRFTYDELVSLSCDDIVEQMESALSEIDVEIYMSILLSNGIRCSPLELGVLQNEDNSPSLTNNGKVISAAFRNRISNLLNTLEWFSMNFTTRVANDETVYQSLHQVYLTTVGTLYYFICSYNKEDNSKYYTNIISLYNFWTCRQKRYKKKEEKNRAKEEKRKNKNETFHKQKKLGK